MTPPPTAQARKLACGANNIYPAIPQMAQVRTCVGQAAKRTLRGGGMARGAQLRSDSVHRVRSQCAPPAQVFEDPTVAGALTSVLGEGYAMHGHRALHTTRDADQSWHKDSYWGLRRMRHHRPRWAMAMYYPKGATSPRR